VEFIKWNPAAEVSSIQMFDVGIMPLRDTDWERGKCSLKMLTYMACGVPVVVSKVGTNNEILRLGKCGYGVNGGDEWFCSISDLLSNTKGAEDLGRTGREVVMQHYSVTLLAPRFADILRRAAYT
jgi:glycosyltransferase involved in cell wall biosynthesis